MALYPANVRAINVDADRRPILQSVLHEVDIARLWPNARHVSASEASRPEVFKAAVRRATVVVGDLLAPHYPHNSPDGMIVKRRLLARSPDKTHDRKRGGGIKIKQVLLICVRARLFVRFRQPIVCCDKLAHMLLDAS